MKRPVCLVLVALVGSALAALPASAGSNVLRNPTLLQGNSTNVGVEPVDWTRRGQMGFSDARMARKDEAYQFSLTADGSADFPTCSKNGRLHYDGSEAGYFQIYEGVKGGETWRAKIRSKLLTGGRARLFIYARDASDSNLEWKSDLSPRRLKEWRKLRVTMDLPAETDNVVVVLRGRVCKPGTETFRFRKAALRQLSD